jgi:hypothetical protein
VHIAHARTILMTPMMNARTPKIILIVLSLVRLRVFKLTILRTTDISKLQRLRINVRFLFT